MLFFKDFLFRSIDFIIAEQVKINASGDDVDIDIASRISQVFFRFVTRSNKFRRGISDVNRIAADDALGEAIKVSMGGIVGVVFVGSVIGIDDRHS